MKIVLLGDSITQGLGSKRINFTEELSKLCSNAQIKNMALTGTTIQYAVDNISAYLNQKPDLVIVLYGNVDAQLKPCRSGRVFRRLPARFAHSDGSMLLPRPFYSHVWYRYLGQRVENWMRTILRNLIYAIDGTEQWVPIDIFAEAYFDVCKTFRDNGINVVCCSTVAIDDRLFPGSNIEYQRYNAEILRIAKSLGCIYVDLYEEFKNAVDHACWSKWYNDDHFHPNGQGYRLMAKWIHKGIMDLLLSESEQGL